MISNKKVISIGNRKIGGTFPVLIQSMTTTKTSDVDSTVKKIKQLEAAGCEIIRVAVPNMEAAKAMKLIKKQIGIPLVADIHFDYLLALEAIKNGADKIRINPGNIGEKWKIKEIIKATRERNIPIRIGVNSGSVEPDLLKKYKKATPEALVESALRHVGILEELDYNQIVVSIKSSDIIDTIKAYELIDKQLDYPLHIGITEAGTLINGTVKSSIGLGYLLLNGIGNTIRVSLTADPIEEIKVAKMILQDINLRQFGVKLISCPTCGRTNVDIIKIAAEIEKAVENLNKNITVAIMGCAVNGPGEAREADIGIAGGIGEVVLFKKGVPVRKIKEELIIKELMDEINKF